VKPTWVERWILVPALIGYVALLVMAAWRHEIRPAAFDGVTEFARHALGLAGIPPAVAVFSADVGSAPDAKIAAICLEVRALRSGDEGRQIYPNAATPCPAPSPRVWVRGEQAFLHRSVVIVRAAVAAHRAGHATPQRMRFARRLAGAIGAHFVRRDQIAGGIADRYALLWEESRISYRTRTRSENTVALFDWPGIADPQVSIAWRPDDATLRERGWVRSEP
jgi:hypothetical protein